ncbi:MAG: glycerate kinase, partial [Lentilactobacillus hilgardii]
MKFVIAPDSFKGGLSAKEVAEAIKEGIKRVYPNAIYGLVPMADGGEGTV